MRTTLNLDDDVYLFARECAARQQVSIGQVVSELMRRGAQLGSADTATPSRRDDADDLVFVNGIPVIQSPLESPRIVSQTLIDQIREAEGI